MRALEKRGSGIFGGDAALSARRALSGVRFGDLGTKLAVTAADLETGHQVVLHEGQVLPAIQATCAVSGVMRPVEIDGRWLVDSVLVNVLPVDVAWLGEKGMADIQDHSKHMTGPKNTIPMMMGKGPFGNLEMGGMFTVLKVRDNITTYDDPGWYQQPPGTALKMIKTSER